MRQRQYIHTHTSTQSVQNSLLHQQGPYSPQGISSSYVVERRKNTELRSCTISSNRSIALACLAPLNLPAGSISRKGWLLRAEPERLHVVRGGTAYPSRSLLNQLVQLAVTVDQTAHTLLEACRRKRHKSIDELFAEKKPVCTRGRHREADGRCTF